MRTLVLLCLSVSLGGYALGPAALCAQTTILPKTTMFPKVTVDAGASSNTARSFNGTSDVLSNATTYFAGSSGPFTIAFWFRAGAATPFAGSTYILNMGTGDQWSVIYGFVSGKIEFFQSGGTNAAGARMGTQITVNDNLWHHYAYRYDGTIWCFFVDGVKTVISSSIAFTSGTNGGGLAVGAALGPSAWTNGSIARVYLSTAALTDLQIATLAGATCSTTGVSGTTGYWLIQGTASPEAESSPSPNTHSLTVTGTLKVGGPYCTSS